ncbi:hypothetical protein [Butyrivibrio sp. FCS014]|uniref:hypothetical protein n=1 Tax=Butyrivibrio sp. FCS014 TaxID=1408304 RepID=UPI0004666F51|nr:hypothetical protein [Butyrivibrio sp. FCS014]
MESALIYKETAFLWEGAWRALTSATLTGRNWGQNMPWDWLSELVENKVPVTYVPGGDLWNYKLGGVR